MSSSYDRLGKRKGGAECSPFVDINIYGNLKRII
ncbi:MAG: hypothetical protein ACI91Z_001055, partial [Yoonia sp.]